MSQPPLWVFGYGSLIWNPGFPVAEQVLARLSGYHRSFCMRSIHYRGTAQAPGLVLALEERPGASCSGVAFRVEPGTEAETLAALRARELISAAYVERRARVRLDDGRDVVSVSYVIEPDHAQYCGGLSLEEQARTIAIARGDRGPNVDYLLNTVEHLSDLGIDDPELSWLAARVRELTA